MDDQGTAKEVIRRLVKWMVGHPHIQAGLLSSSRANKNAPTDDLSDYDVVLVVSEIAPFATDDSWIQGFGDVLVRFSDKSNIYKIYGIEEVSQLVIYEDGTKIDYTVWPVEVLKRLLEEPKLPENLDVGYHVLLDKANLTVGMKAPTYAAHIPRRPTEEEFNDLVNEFWWETTYVAKNLWRNEIFPAKYSFDVVMRFQLLLKMVEWYVETQHHWSLKPGSLGRGLKKHLPHEIWAEVESTLVGADPDENWSALFGMTSLFRRIAVLIADSLGYSYPQALDERVSGYLHSVQNLPR